MDIELHLLEQNPDVICQTETWLNPEINFEFPGFITVRADRRNQRLGGGVLFIIRREISFSISIGPMEQADYADL